MALFKIYKGSKNDLGKIDNITQYVREGFAYFTPDDGKFYIDTAGSNEPGENNIVAQIGVNRIPLNAVQADYVKNSFILKFANGNTENTNLYTFNGSATKQLNIQSGDGISFTSASNSLTIGINASEINTGILSTANGGTGNDAYIANRLIYSETATKLNTANNIHTDGNTLNFLKDDGSYVLISNKYNNTSYALLRDEHNGNISLNAAGAGLILGSSNTKYTSISNKVKFYSNHSFVESNAMSSTGWIRIAALPLNSNNALTSSVFDLMITRTYTSAAPETYAIRVVFGSGTCTLTQFGGNIKTQHFTKFRIIRDNTNHKAYFELYLNTTPAGDTVHIEIIDYTSKPVLEFLSELETLLDSEVDRWEIPLKTAAIVSNQSLYLSTTNRGLFLTDISGSLYGAIYDTGSDLWIGATARNTNIHTGKLFLHAGKNSDNIINRSIYVSIGDNDTATTATDYVIAYGSGGSSSQPVYIDTYGKVQSITGALGNDITGNAATATAANIISTDNAIVRFDGTSGQFQNSQVLIGDSGDITTTSGITIGSSYLIIKPYSPTYDSTGADEGIKFYYNHNRSGYYEDTLITSKSIQAANFYGALKGNADTAAAFSSNRTIELTGAVTGSQSGNGASGWSIETTIPTESIANNKLANSTIGIAGTNVALGSSISKTTLLSNLGLTNAAHYIGKATNDLTDGGTENPFDTSYTPQSGDIVLGKDGDKEYIWGLNGWELLGPVDTIQASTGTGIQNRMAYYSAANMISSSSHYTTNAEVAINKTSITNGYSFEVNGDSIYDGNIRLNNTVLERLIASKKAEGPGWARNIISILDNAGTSFAHLGAYGSAEEFFYLYLGSGAYNSANNLRIYPAAEGQSEKITIGRSTVAAPAATLYVKGTPGEFTFRDRAITPVATFDGQTYFTGGLNSASYILTNVTNASTAKNVSGDGSYYLYGNNVQYGRLCIVNMGLAPTENEGTYSGASAGHARLILGNSKINANSAEGEADNAYGDILLYRNNGSYTVYEPAAIYYQNNLENADVFSYQGSKSTTANEDAYATWVLGNSVNKTSTTGHSEGRLRIYSASTGYHQITGTSTTGARVHYFPDASGWIVTGGNGTTTGVGEANQPIYINNQGVATAVSLKPTLNNLLDSLTEGSATALVDAGYIISSNNNGDTSDWYLRSNDTIWQYIKGKYSSTNTALETGPIHIRSNTGGNNALIFDRPDGEYQYIQSKNPDNNINIVFAASNSDANTTYRFTKDAFFPKANNSKDLGLSANKWANIYATTVHAALDGNAATATKWAAAQKVYVTLGTASTTTTIQGGSTSAQTIGVDGILGTANGGTGNNSFTQYGIIYANPATKLVSTAAGTAGYPLIGQGSAAPAWYGGQVNEGTAAASWITSFKGTTASTSMTTGAVKVAGGLGVAGQVTALRAGLNGSNTSYTLYVNGNSYHDGNITLSANYSIDKPGKSISWWQGRDYALTRITSVAGYTPLTSIKTTNGSWDIGHYNSGSWVDKLLFNYITDTTHSATSSDTANYNKKYGWIEMINDGGLVIGKSDTYIDNTAFKNTLLIENYRNQESTYPALTETKPSFGIGFNFKWSDGTVGTFAGIYGVGLTNWRAGLAFRIKKAAGTSSTPGKHDQTVAWMTGDGLIINGKTVINPSYSALTNSYNEGLRINRGTNGVSCIILGGTQGTTTSTGNGVWYIGSVSTPANATAAAADITNSNFYISYNGSTSAASRIQGHDASGFSIRPRLAVNADVDTGYNFYVNGSSDFNGNIYIRETTEKQTAPSSAQNRYIFFHDKNASSNYHAYIGSQHTASNEHKLIFASYSSGSSGNGGGSAQLQLVSTNAARHYVQIGTHLRLINNSSNDADDAVFYLENKSNNDWAQIINLDTYNYGLSIASSGINLLKVGTNSVLYVHDHASDAMARRIDVNGRIDLHRYSNINYGYLSFYHNTYKTWIEYMSGQHDGSSPQGGKPGVLGNVTSWARRSLVEKASGYGWIWEYGTNTAASATTTVSTTPVMALSSNDGTLEVAGLIKSTKNSNTVTIGSQNANFTHIYNSADIPFIVNKSFLTTTGNLGNTSYPWNNIYLGNSAGTANADIVLHSSQANNTMIRFLVQTANGDGQGIRIGGGGLTIIGGGESAATVHSGTGYANSAEQMIIANDNEIRFYPNQGSAYTPSALIQMTAGCIWAGVNGDTTRENKIGVQSGAGQLYLYSAAATTGAKGLYFPAANGNPSGYIAHVDSAHRVYFNTNFTSQRVKLIANQGSEISSGIWLRTCIVQAYNNYANFQIRLTGGWSTGSPTVATIDVNMRNGAASMHLVHRGFLGVIGKVKLVKLATNTAYLDVYVREATNNTDYFGQFIGNVTVTQNTDTTNGTTNKTVSDETGLVTLDLTAAVGNSTTPVYINAAGNPVACTAYGSATVNIANKLKTTQATNATKMFILGQSAAGAGQDTYIATAYSSGSANATGIYFQGSTGVLMGAAWNDYAEFRQSKENKKIEPGKVVYENGDDTLSMSNKRLMRGCSIVSDTYGFGIGESEEAQLPIAVSGRVLAYPYEDKEEFKNHIGWPVCSGPNGTVSIMTEEEEEKYPSRIIGIISAVPDYEIWHGGADVEVNGRVWIKVR